MKTVKPTTRPASGPREPRGIWTVLRKLFWVARPISWPNTAYPFAAGYLLSGGKFGAVCVFSTLFFFIPYNLLMYGVNDVFDYESDILNPRKGGIEGMREERAFHPTILVACAVITIPTLAALFLVSFKSSGAAAAGVLAAVIFMVLAYSLKGLRFKEIPFLDSFTSACHFVGPLVFALSLTGRFSGGWPYIIAFFLWGMASHAFGAVQDIVPDRKGGLSSIATVLGAKRTVRLTVGLYFIAGLSLCREGGLVSVIGLSSLLYIINIISYWSVSDTDSAVTNTAWKRFIWLNYFAGFIVTIVIILNHL